MSHSPTYGPDDLLTSLLRDVSRSFYLTLRILPAPIRKQIGLAYLLARATDTVADTSIIPLAARLETLCLMRARIQGDTRASLDLTRIAEEQGSPGESALLRRIGDAFAVLDAFAAEDRDLVREALTTITSGQELDLKRFALANSREIVALQADAELDDYTYRVAGCVGEFWTKICLAHLGGPSSLDGAGLIQNGIRFGKGLQLVNILRDLSSDLLQGRCYFPSSTLAGVPLKPKDLTVPANMSLFRPLYDEYLDRAQAHLAAGWEYTNALPFGWVRVRLACAWPILFGLRTIAHLRQANPLDGANRVKASRAEVKRLMAASVAAYPFPPIWRRLYKIAGDIKAPYPEAPGAPGKNVPHYSRGA